MKKKIFLRVVLFMLTGNMIFAAAENQKIENFQNVEVKASDVRQKIENEIVGKAEVEVKSFKKNKLNKFISKVTGKNWKMVWNDEFNGNQLDTTKWTYWENGNHWHAGNYLDENGNLVNQYGFDAKHFYLRDNVKIENGNMIITLKKETDKKVRIDGVDRKI